MSSSNPNNAGQGLGSQTVTIGGGRQIYAAGLGVSSMTLSSGEINALSGTTSSNPRRLQVSEDGGEPSIMFEELQPDGTLVRARLEPENSMTVSELAKVMSLVMVLKESNHHFISSVKPIAYIRKHNLERHFRFSAA